MAACLQVGPVAAPGCARSPWSRIDRLTSEGLLADAGQAAIDQARADGSWSQLDQVDDLIVPPDLQTALNANPDAAAAYASLADSAKKQYLWRIHSAKRPATRTNRIAETVRRLSTDGNRNPA